MQSSQRVDCASEVSRSAKCQVHSLYSIYYSGSQPGAAIFGNAWENLAIPPPLIFWQCLDMFLVVTTGRILPASHGQRPGMLLHILQCTGPSPATKNYLAPNSNSAKFEETCCIIMLGVGIYIQHFSNC